MSHKHDETSQMSAAATSGASSSTSVLPTMGRIVLYKDADTELCPAMVTTVRASTIGLFVFTDHGRTKWIHDAEKAKTDDADGWRWPPKVPSAPAMIPEAPASTEIEAPVSAAPQATEVSGSSNGGQSQKSSQHAEKQHKK